MIDFGASLRFRSSQADSDQFSKTGSGRDHGWFAGYVPAEDPQVAFVAVLEHGGSGGRVAGPLAKGLVEEMLRLGLVIPATDPDADSADSF